jgi:PTS system mannose-specific IIA component
LVGIIVATHGRMAEGIVDAVQMIVGEQDQLETISLLEMEDVEGLMEKIESVVTSVSDGQGVLVLVDLPGASPFNASARLAMADDSIKVVTGVNLPMLAEILVLRDGKNLDELVALAKDSGIKGIKTLSDILNRS